MAYFYRVTEFETELSDLTRNSKSLINHLTTLARNNMESASIIVDIIEKHISSVPQDGKLPILFLIDSILKNIKFKYVMLLNSKIGDIFWGVFKMATKNVRKEMYRLRGTWTVVFPTRTLHELDLKMNSIDPKWPVLQNAKMMANKLNAIRNQVPETKSKRQSSRSKSMSFRDKLLVKRAKIK